MVSISRITPIHQRFQSRTPQRQYPQALQPTFSGNGKGSLLRASGRLFENILPASPLILVLALISAAVVQGLSGNGAGCPGYLGDLNDIPTTTQPDSHK